MNKRLQIRIIIEMRITYSERLAVPLHSSNTFVFSEPVWTGAYGLNDFVNWSSYSMPQRMVENQLDCYERYYGILLERNVRSVVISATNVRG